MTFRTVKSAVKKEIDLNSLSKRTVGTDLCHDNRSPGGEWRVASGTILKTDDYIIHNYHTREEDLKEPMIGCVEGERRKFTKEFS